MNRTQQLYSVRPHTTVGPEYEDCPMMPPIRAHNDCDVELLSDDGTNQRRYWLWCGTIVTLCTHCKKSNEWTTQQNSCIVCQPVVSFKLAVGTTQQLVVQCCAPSLIMYFHQAKLWPFIFISAIFSTKIFISKTTPAPPPTILMQVMVDWRVCGRLVPETIGTGDDWSRTLTHRTHRWFAAMHGSNIIIGLFAHQLNIDPGVRFCKPERYLWKPRRSQVRGFYRNTHSLPIQIALVQKTSLAKISLAKISFDIETHPRSTAVTVPHATQEVARSIPVRCHGFFFLLLVYFRWRLIRVICLLTRVN